VALTLSNLKGEDQIVKEAEKYDITILTSYDKNEVFNHLKECITHNDEVIK
jgi:hypothetical protein